MSAGSKSSDGLDDATCTIMETSMLEEEGYFDPAEGSGAGLSGAGGKKRLESLCRVCANVSDYFIPVFEREGAEHQLDMKIRKHLPIRVLETDGLPAQVCYQCASTLIAWHDLVTACVEADKKLHRLLLEEEDDDYADRDEKVVEFFNEPPVDSDGEDFSEPSTSAAVVETKECLPPQKKRTSGKGKQQRKAQRASNASPESGAKGNTALSDSKETGAGQKGAVDSALSTERDPPDNLQASFHSVRIKEESAALVCDSVPTANAAKSTAVTKFDFDGWSDWKHCTHCPQVFLKQSALAVHLFEDHSMNVFYCEVCNKVFKNRDCQAAHLATHETAPASKPKSAPVAPQQTATEPSRRPSAGEGDDGSRAKTGRKTERKLHECEECGKRLRAGDSYRAHLRSHSGEKPFVCHLCGKHFSRRNGLHYHLRHVHGGVKEHACDVCGRSFALRAFLAEHRLIHTGERPHMCDACGKTFRSKASLYIHRRLHTDSFPFPCGRCDKRFRWRQQLLSHLRRHAGEKPYQCDVCLARFATGGNLKRHRTRHSADKPFPCTKCGLSFSQKRYLSNHDKSRHQSVEAVKP